MAADTITTIKIIEHGGTPPVTFSPGAWIQTLATTAVGFDADYSYYHGTPTGGPLSVTVPKAASFEACIYWMSGPIGKSTRLYPSTYTPPRDLTYLDVTTANSDVTFRGFATVVCDSTGLFKYVIRNGGNSNAALTTTGLYSSTEIDAIPGADYVDVLSTDRVCRLAMFDNALAHASASFQVTGYSQDTDMSVGAWERQGEFSAAAAATVVVAGTSDGVYGTVDATATATIAAAATVEVSVSNNVTIACTATVSPTALTGQTETGIAALTANATAAVTGDVVYTLVTGYRFRQDDGDETTATWDEALNVGLTGAKPGVTYRVRFAIKNPSLTPQTSINRGHLEISEDGGDFYTMGMNDYATPVVSPAFSLVTASTITPSYSGELTGVTRALFYITNSGVWVTAYRGRNATDSSIQLVVRVSNNEGVTWLKNIIPSPYADDAAFTFNQATPLLIREDKTGAIVIYYNDWASGFSTDAFNYIVRSTTDGLSWSDPKRTPVMLNENYIYYFFIDNNNDYIIPESNTFANAAKYHVSTDQGDNWTAYLDTSFPLTTKRITRAHYELDETGTGLTISFMGMTISGNNSTDPVNLYEYTDASPYSGFPNLGDDDVGIRIASVTSGLTIPSIYLNASFTMRINNDDGATLAGGILSLTDELHVFIVDTPTGYKATAINHTESDFIEPSNFLFYIEKYFVGRNGMEFRSDNTDGGFFLQCSNMNGFTTDPHRTPGFMGYQELSNTQSRMIYSPDVGKWYYATVAAGTVTISEMYYSGVTDGEHTTQQISSGAFASVNYGNTHFNTIHGESGIDIPAGETVEYEYAFTLEASANIEGKVICMRPSGFGAHLKNACFTIPSKECLMRATASIIATGFTDSAKSALSSVATLAVSGEVLRNCAVSMAVSATVAVTGFCTKFGIVDINSTALMTGEVNLIKPSACSLVSNATITADSLNSKPFAVSLSAASTMLVSEPAIEVPAKASLLGRAFMSPTATKGLEAAASLHSYASVAASAQVDELCISITVYQSPSLLTIIEPEALNVVDFPAKLTVNQPPVPDLVVTEQSPLQVHLYE